MHTEGDNCRLNFQEPCLSLLSLCQAPKGLKTHGSTLPPPRSRWQLQESFLLQLGQVLGKLHWYAGREMELREVWGRGRNRAEHSCAAACHLPCRLHQEKTGGGNNLLSHPCESKTGCFEGHRRKVRDISNSTH